jgi:hypothetical protein
MTHVSKISPPPGFSDRSAAPREWDYLPFNRRSRYERSVPVDIPVVCDGHGLTGPRAPKRQASLPGQRRSPYSDTRAVRGLTRKIREQVFEGRQLTVIATGGFSRLPLTSTAILTSTTSNRGRPTATNVSVLRCGTPKDSRQYCQPPAVYMSVPFYEDESRVLTPPAFEFVFDAELKRAVRSQTFLTLVLIEAKREWEDLMVAADESTVAEVGRLVGHVVRDTDLVSKTDEGVLVLVLLDANFDDSARVIDRLVSRIDSYTFPLPLHISLGAACFPTHAVDSNSLKQQASSRPVANWRSGPPTPKAADSRN